MFIREPSFNKPADRHAAKLPRVPKEVSLLILLSLVTSHGIMSNSGDPVVAYCTPRQGAAAKERLNTAGGKTQTGISLFVRSGRMLTAQRREGKPAAQ